MLIEIPDYEDISPPKVLPEDTECEVRITRVDTAFDKNGEPYMLVYFEVVDEPEVKDFTHFVRLPHKNLDQKRLHNCKWRLKEFCTAFDIPHPIETEDLPGSTGWVILRVKDDEVYGEQNAIKRFVLPGGK